MRKLGLNLLIIIVYCFPFVHFAMDKDFNNGSMVGYLMMIVITSLIAFLGKWSNNIMAIVIGNIASAFVSYYFISNLSGEGGWDGTFFKPLGPTGSFIFFSMLNLIPQFLAMKLANKFKKKV
ncbi:hypothetical protein BSK49_08200 [Paenibacillus odorifer]|uniref:hypothetical protein n=1 Tax=Paenibacillus odorifer TaxID=189426 RepID=UPI00096F2911|nr:hypothetical protein [Paenibacillus odorifer]OMD90550.1 hypothetical protein BSK49_08200 [Paenibacillus odorifer]